MSEPATAIEPVKNWYQSDEAEPRPIVDIITDIVADLQEDRQDVLAMSGVMRELNEANQKIVEAAAEIERLREALREIAAINDTLANDFLENHKSYGAFDEPGSVMIARAALAQGEKP